MHEINISADQLVESLLKLPNALNLCLLDSCGISYLNSHFLIAGISPVERLEITETKAEQTLKILDEKLTQKDLFSIFTVSYDFGMKLNRIKSRHAQGEEPDIFLAQFDTLIIHDYRTRKTYLIGNEKKFEETGNLLLSQTSRHFPELSASSRIRSNFSRQKYLDAVEQIQKLIRCGDTYQTNLTQQIHAQLPVDLTPEMICP